jgi:type I restriction enzyme R subunit
MNKIGKPERETQNRLIKMLRDEPGYRFLRFWGDRPNNTRSSDKFLSKDIVNGIV